MKNTLLATITLFGILLTLNDSPNLTPNIIGATILLATYPIIKKHYKKDTK